MLWPSKGGLGLGSQLARLGQRLRPRRANGGPKMIIQIDDLEPEASPQPAKPPAVRIGKSRRPYTAASR